MRNIPDALKEPVSDPIITFREKGRCIRFMNPRRLAHIKVHVDDAGVAVAPRCDFLLTSGDERIEYFVELKGTDIRHAIEQLRNSITCIGEFTDHRHAYVVGTNLAPALRTDVQKAKLEFMRKLKSTLDIKERSADVSTVN